MSHHQPSENQKPSKTAYHAPALRVYGDIRDVTLGGTPGMGESGKNVGVKKPKTG
jgi:hypothetical protein